MSVINTRFFPSKPRIMGFKDQAAESGAELTRLQNQEEPNSTGSVAQPWTAFDLLKEEKKKESLGFEPGQYALKGSEPQVGSGEVNVQVPVVKRFGGSSMARNVVEEPVGEKLPMFALKPTKPDAVLPKKFDDGYYPVSSTGGEHKFASKMAGSEPATFDKKLILSRAAEIQDGPLLQKSESKAGLAGSAQFIQTYRPAEDWSGAVKLKSQLGAEEQTLYKLKPDLGGGPVASAERTSTPAVEKFFTPSVEKFATQPAERFTTQPIEKSAGAGGAPVIGMPTSERLTTFGGPVLEKDKIYSTSVPLSSLASSPVVEKGNVSGVEKINLTGSEKVMPVQGGSASVTSALQQTEQSGARKFGAPNVQTQLAAPTELKGAPLVQTQIASVQSFAPGKEKVGGSGSGNGSMPALQPERVATIRTQSQEIQQVQPKPTALKLEQALSGREQGVNRSLTLQDQTPIRRQEFSIATAGNGNSPNAMAMRNAEVAPSAVRKLTVPADSGTRGGATGVEIGQPLQGKKLLTETTPLAQLPSNFVKPNPQLAQIEKYSADTQLRAQADKIASGAQANALTDQSNIKLKGEVALTNLRQPDQIAVVKPGQQQLENGLQPRANAFNAIQQQQQLENGLQPRIAPLTGKTTQDLVSALKPQDKVTAGLGQNTELISGDRRSAASVIRTGTDALTTPYTIDRATGMSTAHVISGEVKLATGKMGANAPAGEILNGDKKAAPASHIAVLLNNVKDGKGDISRSLAFDRLMSNPVKSTEDRYVGGEFLLASMIIAAGAARRMPEHRAEGQVLQPRLEDSTNSSKTIKATPFAQLVDSISKAFTTGRTAEQIQAIEASRRASINQGQSDSVRYITGVELAILLAAGGVSRLRNDKSEAKATAEGKTTAQAADEAAARTTKVANSKTNFVNGRQPLNTSADTHITTQIVASMLGQRTDFMPPSVQPFNQPLFQPPVQTGRTTDVPASTVKVAQHGQPSDLVVRGERCIPGADVAIAAMLMLGGVTRKRTEERLPANPNELAEKVDRPFRLDRRLGEIVAQAKSFVAREPLPITGLRATAANLVAAGDVSIPPQYKQGAPENKIENSLVAQQFATNKLSDTNAAAKKINQDAVEVLAAPAGWVHQPLLNKDLVEEASEEILKKVEQDQQEGAGAGSAKTLYRPIWIIAPGETFVSIAEAQFGDGAIAWLIADLNVGKFTDSTFEGKRVIEIQCRQRIELPVASDIEEFRHKRQRHQDAENIITIVTASQLDIELKAATFKQFLGTLQSNMPVPGMAILPQLDLVQQKPARTAAFNISAPQFASIAAAVSLPLIVPQLDMVQNAVEATAAHVQEMRTETAKPEESI